MYCGNLDLDKKSYIDIKEWDEGEIIKTFKQSQLTQLPVKENNRILGILDLYYYLKNVGIRKRINDVIFKDIIIANENDDILNYTNLKQRILPVFNDSKIYLGFAKKDEIKDIIERKIKNRKKMQKHSKLIRCAQKEMFFISNAMKEVVNLAMKVALVNSTILIQGESGVGKGVMSKFIHSNSIHKNGPFVKIDCSAIPKNIIESELFGYEKGAFTGANEKGKKGLIEWAENGTLFLDEVGELPYDIQAKLLRAIQDREFYRVGGNKIIHFNARIIAATNRRLKEMIKEKEFREDLYYRLNVIPIFIPPLRNRKKDIEIMLFEFLSRYNKKYNLNKEIDLEAVKVLINYNWPGNVRELENVIERLAILSNSNLIELKDIPNEILTYYFNEDNRYITDNESSLKKMIDDYEKKIFKDTMKKTKDIKEIAEILKLDCSTIRRKIKKHGLKES